MNKFIKLVSVAAMSSLLVACGGGSDDNPEGGNLGKSTYKQNWNNLKSGMGTGPVKRYLGEPEQVKAVKAENTDYVYEFARLFCIETEKGTAATATEPAKPPTLALLGTPGVVRFTNGYVTAITMAEYPSNKTVVYEYSDAEAWAHKTGQPYPSCSVK